MLVTRFKRAYKKNGKTAYPQTLNKSGVYLIANKTGEIVYVGYSRSNLYKTMYRHFQKWIDEGQQRATFPKFYKIRVVLTSPGRARKLEKALIVKYKPKGNPDKLESHEVTPAEKHQEIEYLVTPLSSVPF